MKKEETIFDELFERKVCFAVCISKSKLKMQSFGFGGINYFIIVHRSDGYNVRKLFFKKSESDKRLKERDIDRSEIILFKSFRDDRFNRILHNDDGSIYELKDSPFKKHYHKANKIEDLKEKKRKKQLIK